MSALDRAAKSGAIHPNAAARRKSRLARKVNAVLGGAQVQTALRVTKTTGKAAAAKAAKARVAAGKAVKAKGAQTAAGKARAALSKTARVESGGSATTADGHDDRDHGPHVGHGRRHEGHGGGEDDGEEHRGEDDQGAGTTAAKPEGDRQGGAEDDREEGREGLIALPRTAATAPDLRRRFNSLGGRGRRGVRPRGRGCVTGPRHPVQDAADEARSEARARSGCRRC